MNMIVPNQTLTPEDFASNQEVRWCPGCGDYAVLSQIQKLMPTLGIPRENFAFISGIGCSSRIPGYTTAYGFNTVHGRALPIAQGIKRGEGISGPLRKSGQFPPLAGHLLAVGEETGRLDQMFARMADIFETDTRAAIRRFTSLFEPLIILVMGIMVGVLILSMLLAITSINDVAM